MVLLFKVGILRSSMLKESVQMALPVVSVTLSSSLVWQSNGQLDSSLLVNIHPKGLLHRQTARAWHALVAECGRIGLPLTFTYGGCYRTYDSQYNLFMSRYTQVSYASYLLLSSSKRKTWLRNGQNTYWKLKDGYAMAAVPGRSNHGLGIAIDTAFDRDPSDGLGPDDASGISGHPQFAWFRDNIWRFGFSFEVQSEPWHIRYFAGDNIPQAVLDHEQGVNAPVWPPFDPANALWGLYPLGDKPTIQYGARGDAVKYLQGVLKFKAGQIIVIDGAFGFQTKVAVMNLQRFFGLAVNGICAKGEWAMIDYLATH